MKTTPDSSRSVVYGSAAILLPAVLYFAVVADLPHVLLLTLIFLVMAGFRRDGWRLTDRTVIYSLLTAVALAVFGDYLMPLRRERFGFMSYLARPGLTVPFLVYLAALAAGFRRRGHALGLAAAAALFTLSLPGEFSAERRGPSERFVFGDILLSKQLWFYFAALTVSTVAALAGLRSGSARAGFRRQAYLFVLFLFIIGLFAAGFEFYRANQRLVRSWENKLLRLGFRRLGGGNHHSSSSIGEAPNLAHPFPPDDLERRREVLLRAVTRQAPGYLRLGAFRSYRFSRWEEPSQTGVEALIPEQAKSGIAADQYYPMTEGEARPGRGVLYLAGERLGMKRLATPGVLAGVELIAEAVNRSPDGAIVTENAIRDGGYQVYQAKPEPRSAWPEPAEPDAEYLQLPERLQPTLARLAKELELAAAATDRERFQRAEVFFKRQFTYGLDWPGTPRGTDPLEYFLTRHRRGHCELFASGLALLLREAGIPTRYVTGLVCFEPHTSGRYYLARVGNLHAWTEAFDRDEKRWVLLDCTPDGVVEPPPSAGNWKEELAGGFDWIKMLMQQVLADLRRGRFADAIITAAGAGWQGLSGLLLHPVLGPLTLLLLFWLFRRRLRRLLRPGETRELRRLQGELERCCRRLQKRKLLPPQSEPTAAELLLLLESDPRLPPEEKEELRRFLGDYLRRRFG